MSRSWNVEDIAVPFSVVGRGTLLLVVPARRPQYPRPVRRRLAVAFALAALASIAVWAPLPWRPDTVGPFALAEAMAVDLALPVSAHDTDVILVIGCTLRADRLGIYGGGPTTPFLNALAQRATVFTANYTQAPWTRPSVGTILTGRWPRALHLDDPNTKEPLSLILDGQFTTLAEIFQAAGYRTVGAVSNPNAKAAFGLAQGFDAYDEPDGVYRDGVRIPSGKTLVDQLLAGLDATPPGQRFFGEILFTTTHQPRKPGPRDSLVFSFVPTERPEYDAALRQLDGQLARLYVEARQRRKNLLFVLVGDHGEGLRLPRAHGPGHGNHLYQSHTRVPWIVSHPALPASRVDAITLNLDVAPTLLGLLGLPPGSTDGISHAAAVRGAGEVDAGRVAYAETYFKRSRKSARIDAKNLLVHDLKAQTFAMFSMADPDATKDVSVRNAQTFADAKAELAAWEAEMNRVGAAGTAIYGTPDEPTRQMLEALGYEDR